MGHSHAPSSSRRTDVAPDGRVRAVLVGIVVLLAVASGIGIAALWPGDVETPDLAVGGYEGIEVVEAEVLSSESGPCPGLSEDRLPDGSIPVTAECATASVRLVSGAEEGRELVVDVPAPVFRSGLEAGDRVDLALYPAQEGMSEDVYAWSDFHRDVPVATLAVVFALVVVAVGRLRGLAALVGLGVSYATIVGFMLPALRAGEDAVGVALSGSVAIMVVILYLAHGFSMKTTTALLGTVAGLGVIAVLGWAGSSAAHLTGLTSEDDYSLSQLMDGGDLSGIVLCGIIVAGLGVLNDVTITQASSVFEIAETAPRATRTQLFSSGMRIGRDHLASTVYTIAFAYAGAALPTLLLIDIYDQPWRQVLTSGAIAEEVVRTAVAAIGLVAAIPLTTAIAAASVRRSAGRSTLEGMSEHPGESEADVAAVREDHARQASLQEIVDRLTAEYAGETPQRVREVLEKDMTAAGFELGAEKWLGDTAVEIAAGRGVVVDRTQDRSLD